MQPTLANRFDLLVRFIDRAPFQPATNLWRAVELEQLIDALPSSGTGLDIGCGDGVLTGLAREAKQADWHLVGIDPDPAESILAGGSGVYERVHTITADSIPEPGATFDFAFANSVLEHVADLPACLAEIARCLKPDGLFVATVPGPDFHDCLRGPRSNSAIVREEYLREIDARLEHLHYWSIERWQQGLQAVGLEGASFASYLTEPQVRRWEFLSNWTGGLLYRFCKRRKRPIAIQRGLALRRSLPRAVRWLARPLASAIASGVLESTSNSPRHGCLLVRARKQ